MSHRGADARRERALARLRERADAALSWHALQRAEELGFSEDDVLQAVVGPEQTYCCSSTYGPDRVMHQRADVAVVVDVRDRKVITVLLRTGRPWVHGVDRRQTA